MDLKVCGITGIDQLEAIAALGIRYGGFIFYPPSVRHAERFGLQAAQVKRFRQPIYKVGVFVNASYDTIMRTVEAWGLDAVQLHGHETPYECERILPHIDVIKAVRFIENDHVLWTIKDYFSCTDMLLLDTGVPAPAAERADKSLHGGIGRRFSWNRLRGVDIPKPFLLSGGIEPGDAEYVREYLSDSSAKHLAGVDINSRFESSPGVKNLELVETFAKQIRQYNTAPAR